MRGTRGITSTARPTSRAGGLHAQARRVVERQEAFVRKVVTELNGFDNLYYEICNEPYFGGVTLEWQAIVGRSSTPRKRCRTAT